MYRICFRSGTPTLSPVNITSTETGLRGLGPTCRRQQQRQRGQLTAVRPACGLRWHRHDAPLLPGYRPYKPAALRSPPGGAIYGEALTGTPNRGAGCFWPPRGLPKWREARARVCYSCSRKSINHIQCSVRVFSAFCRVFICLHVSSRRAPTLLFLEFPLCFYNPPKSIFGQ